jgi:hypothetical protein
MMDSMTQNAKIQIRFISKSNYVLPFNAHRLLHLAKKYKSQTN